MAINLQVTFRGFDAPLYAEERIAERVAKLERMYPSMMALNVVGERQLHRHHKGTLYQVRLEAIMPGGPLPVTRAHGDKHAHEDFFVALRDAFDALERRLRSFSDKLSVDIKHHDLPPHGVVTSVAPDHGFIRTSDGQEVYFHANSVTADHFKDVEVGSEVRFAVADKEGRKGPQASTVHLVGKHHLH